MMPRNLVKPDAIDKLAFMVGRESKRRILARGQAYSHEAWMSEASAIFGELA